METEDGAFKEIGWRFGKISRAGADAEQWARWGFDFLK
jgi:hypothetical protein